MNGVHDLGGMQGMGPIAHEKNEPVFHAGWQARAFALTRLMGAWKRWNLDAMRYERELIPPADYFRMSYYERWIEALTRLMVKEGLITEKELESGKAAPGTMRMTPPLTAGKVPLLVSKGVPANRDLAIAPRFQVVSRCGRVT